MGCQVGAGVVVPCVWCRKVVAARRGSAGACVRGNVRRSLAQTEAFTQRNVVLEETHVRAKHVQCFGHVQWEGGGQGGGGAPSAVSTEAKKVRVKSAEGSCRRSGQKQRRKQARSHVRAGVDVV